MDDSSWVMKGNKLPPHLLTLLQNIRSTMLCQTLIEILNCFFIFLLFEVWVPNPSQSPIKETRIQIKCHNVKLQWPYRFLNRKKFKDQQLKIWRIITFEMTRILNLCDLNLKFLKSFVWFSIATSHYWSRRVAILPPCGRWTTILCWLLDSCFLPQHIIRPVLSSLKHHLWATSPLSAPPPNEQTNKKTATKTTTQLRTHFAICL